MLDASDHSLVCLGQRVPVLTRLDPGSEGSLPSSSLSFHAPFAIFITLVFSIPALSCLLPTLCFLPTLILFCPFFHRAPLISFYSSLHIFLYSPFLLCLLLSTHHVPCALPMPFNRINKKKLSIFLPPIELFNPQTNPKPEPKIKENQILTIFSSPLRSCLQELCLNSQSGVELLHIRTNQSQSGAPLQFYFIVVLSTLPLPLASCLSVLISWPLPHLAT